MKILIIKISSLGDILNSTYVLTAIKRQFPEYVLDMVIDPRYKEIVENLNVINKFYYFDEFKYSNLLNFKKNGFRSIFNIINIFKEIYKNISNINNNDYDYIIDLQGIEKSLIFYIFSKAKKKVCKWSLPYKNVKENKTMHAVLALFSTTRKLLNSLKIEFNKYLIETIPENLNYTDIIIGPMTRWETKNYPPIFYLILSVLLASEGYSISIVGSSAEKSYWENQINQFYDFTSSGISTNIRDSNKRYYLQYQQKIIKEKYSNIDYKEFFNEFVIKNKIRLCFGSYSLNEIGALLKKTKLFIGSDSFLSHYAHALQTPQIYLFGPTSVLRFGPINSNLSVVLKNNELDCLNCHKRICPKKDEYYMLCMNSIPVEKIYTIAKKIIQIK